jgi:hypothetical protein
LLLRKHQPQTPDTKFDEVPHFFLRLMALRKLRS